MSWFSIVLFKFVFSACEVQVREEGGSAYINHAVQYSGSARKENLNLKNQIVKIHRHLGNNFILHLEKTLKSAL